MADYWKSIPKKFCDFCKCWMYDNKASIDFHESGKTHKANVAKRISEARHKTVVDQKNKQNLESELRKIEEAALRSYQKDLAANPNLAAAGSSIGSYRSGGVVQLQSQVPLWFEAKTEDGLSYYFNFDTGESRWDPPEEGYMSIEGDSNASKEHAVPATTLKNYEKAKIEQGIKRKLESNVNLSLKLDPPPPPPPPADATSNFKEDEEILPKVESFEPALDTAAAANPYGVWKRVDPPKPQKAVDLQLPHVEYVELKVPTLASEPKIKFKEKTVPVNTTAKDEGTKVEFKFKKRKLGEKSLRQRGDD